MTSYSAIGLMSGTSLDGLDICHVKFSKSNNWSFEILKAKTISYKETWKYKLQNATKGHKKSIRKTLMPCKILKKILADYSYKECYNKKNKPK